MMVKQESVEGWMLWNKIECVNKKYKTHISKIYHTKIYSQTLGKKRGPRFMYKICHLKLCCFVFFLEKYALKMYNEIQEMH
jgi:hypothetical protein